MNRFLRVLTTGIVLVTLGSPVAARSRRAAEPAPPPPPVLQVPDSTGVPRAEPAPLGELAPPATTTALPPPIPVATTTQTRKYWELSAVGGAVLGGVYVLSILTGSLSYAGFYEGQWGWFVPLVGPMLTMGGAGGKVCPCFTNQMYTYGIGTVLTLATVGALVPVILGGVLTKKVGGGSGQVQLAPTVTSDSTGLVLLGRF